MFLLVPAHPGCPGQIPQSRKTVVCVCVLILIDEKKFIALLCQLFDAGKLPFKSCLRQHD